MQPIHLSALWNPSHAKLGPANPSVSPTSPPPLRCVLSRRWRPRPETSRRSAASPVPCQQGFLGKGWRCSSRAAETSARALEDRRQEAGLNQSRDRGCPTRRLRLTSVDAAEPLLSRHGRLVSRRHRVQVFLEDFQLKGKTKTLQMIPSLLSFLGKIGSDEKFSSSIRTCFRGTIMDSGSTRSLMAIRR